MKISLIIEPPTGDHGAFTSHERVCGVANIQLQRDTTVSTIRLTLLGTAALFTVCISANLPRQAGVSHFLGRLEVAVVPK